MGQWYWAEYQIQELAKMSLITILSINDDDSAPILC